MPRPDSHKSLRYLRVRDIVNIHDPMDRISIGYPEDEYNSQIPSILKAIDTCRDPEALAVELANIVHFFFDGPDMVRFTDWSALANDLWTNAR